MNPLRGAVAAAFCVALGAGSAWAADGTRVGDVSTTFRLLGRNDKIAVDRYDDPKVQGVSCYLSHAETGGVAGSLGLATDPSRFSLACRATSKPVLKGALPDSEVVFSESTSVFFKELRVSRIYDRGRNVLLYLAWSTRALSTGGSPYNALTAVPLDAP